MPLHNGATDRDIPQYDHRDKQEAADMLSRDIDKEPLIKGMDDLDRVEAWLQVVVRFDAKDVEVELQKRRADLREELDRQAEFETASSMHSGDGALADGGADVLDDGQEVYEQ